MKTKQIIVWIIILLIWFSAFALIYLKADEVTKDPCGICAKKMGEQVICSVGDISRTYYTNGTVEENFPYFR